MSPAESLPPIGLGVPGWCLRAWRPDDAASLARHADDENVWRWMHDGFPHPYTLQAAEQWASTGHIDFGGCNWAIAFEDAAVGGCGIHAQEGPLRCNAEIGWWLGRAFWGLGIGSRAAQQLVALGFQDAALMRLFATIYGGNTRSMRVAERAGLVLEGVLRKSAYKAGRLIDRHLYAIVRPD